MVLIDFYEILHIIQFNDISIGKLSAAPSLNLVIDGNLTSLNQMFSFATRADSVNKLQKLIESDWFLFTFAHVFHQENVVLPGSILREDDN